MSDDADQATGAGDGRTARRPRSPRRWLWRIVGAIIGVALGWWAAGYLN